MKNPGRQKTSERLDNLLANLRDEPVKSRAWATPVAVAVEIHCPSHSCGREDPIPARDGSFMWEKLPSVVTCPDCGAEFRVKTTITM